MCGQMYDTVANEMMKEISSAEKIYDNDRIETNSVYMMADSVLEVSSANETIGWYERFNCKTIR